VKTAIGACAVAWTARGISRVRLCEEAPSAATPPWVREVIERLARHLYGAPQDFRDVPLDLGGATPFERRVYAAARRIPWGRTVTYGELARRIGSPGAARAVGRALGRNPVAVLVPCHRVVAAGGLGGFSAGGGVATKERLLEAERQPASTSSISGPTSRRASERS
jgi:methylated-DNA-[protein]-cysteine S-methyltransferase